VTFLEIGAYSAQGQGPSGMIFLILSSNGSGNPACATTKNEVAVDITTNAGLPIEDLAAKARMTGQTVNIGGTGTCALDAALETLSNIGF
jgi:hypothetical protein